MTRVWRVWVNADGNLSLIYLIIFYIPSYFSSFCTFSQEDLLCSFNMIQGTFVGTIPGIISYRYDMIPVYLRTFEGIILT